MIRHILLLMSLAVVTNSLISFPPRPTRPKLIQLDDHKRVELVNNDYVIHDFVGLVRKQGYPAEEHTVVTHDGYILKFHRIPGSPYSPKSHGKPVIFLQHGLFSSSDVWVLMGPNKDLAFIAADAGFDVWMGNVRGNTYGRSHIRLSPDRDPQFWFYSYHEIAMYDIPAMVDYILQLTSQRSVIYIGHSQGTTISYALLSWRPEYNSKFRLVISLSPITIWVTRPSDIYMFIMKNVGVIKGLTEKMGIYEILPQSSFNIIFAKKVCTDKSPVQPLCVLLYYFMFGTSKNQLNTTMLSTLLPHNPAGTSAQSILHYFQNIEKGTFQAYDYGNAKKNMQKYNRAYAPYYNLKNVVAPVVLFYGLGDTLSRQAEATYLGKYLSNLVSVEAVPDKNFNHMDFILAKDAKRLLYDRIMQFITVYKKDNYAGSQRYHTS